MLELQSFFDERIDYRNRCCRRSTVITLMLRKGSGES